MQTHEAKVPILHRLCYRNSNVKIFTVPETSISCWNCNVFNQHTADVINWHL